MAVKAVRFSLATLLVPAIACGPERDAPAHNEPDDAITEYRQAIDLDPNIAAAQYNLGNALQRKGQLHDAIAEYLYLVNTRGHMKS